MSQIDIVQKLWNLLRIHNLLRQLAEAQLIRNAGSRRFSKWVLIARENNQ